MKGSLLRGSIGALLCVTFGSCTATQVRWDASNIREQVMVYYNDQIMDNLIKAKNNLPFVHVDIQTLTSQGASTITGTIGGGENQTVTKSGPIGALNMISKAVTRPFTYSVAPTRSETLSITAAPALGSQALASSTPEPSPSQSTSPSPKPEMEVTRVTEVRKAEGELERTTTEKTPKLAQGPKTITIYELYEHFAKGPPKALLADDPTRPEDGTFVPGTRKRWGKRYYYIRKADQEAYYEFCKRLFTKGQATSLEKEFQVIRAAAETQKTQLATPEPP